MSESPLSTRLIQTVGISTTLLIGGANIAYSVVLVPRILESPTPLLVRQWDHAYEQGKRSIPPVAVFSGISYFYLAYNEHTAAFPASWKVPAYATAGVLAASMIPYTLVFMLRNVNKLKAKLAETSALQNTDEVVEVGLGSETAHKLVDDWAVMNLGRGAMLTISGVLGLWTALN